MRRVLREPALLLGVVTSGLALAVLFGVDITRDQLAGITLFLGAVIALLRFILTPTNEVVAQQKPDGTVAAGPAARAGQTVVHMEPKDPPIPVV